MVHFLKTLHTTPSYCLPILWLHSQWYVYQLRVTRTSGAFTVTHAVANTCNSVAIKNLVKIVKCLIILAKGYSSVFQPGFPQNLRVLPVLSKKLNCHCHLRPLDTISRLLVGPICICGRGSTALPQPTSWSFWPFRPQESNPRVLWAIKIAAKGSASLKMLKNTGLL